MNNGFVFRTHLIQVRSKLLAEYESIKSEEHTSELQSQSNIVCRLLLEKKKNMSAGVAAAASALWPEYRLRFLALSTLLAPCRFLLVAYYLYEPLMGFAFSLVTCFVYR